MLAFYSVCSIFWLFSHEAIFLIQDLFHYSFYFRISFSNIKKTVCTGWIMSESFWSVFGYYEILKVKHREKMFSNIFWSYNETLLAIKCKTITLEVTQKRLYWTGGLLQNNCWWLLLMLLQGKMFSIFLSPYTEFSRALCFKSSPTEVFY